MFETLKLAFPGELAILTLNRPEKRNAISPQMLSELQSAFDTIEKSHARIGSLTRAGDACSAAIDLEMPPAIARQSPQENMDDSRRMARIFRRIWTFTKPLIAAVNGAALAGGCG